jgi:hypothetical protein
MGCHIYGAIHATKNRLNDHMLGTVMYLTFGAHPQRMK